MNTALNIGIAGCTGRMGLALLNAAQEAPTVTLAAGSVREGADAASIQAQLATAACQHLALFSHPAAFTEACDAIIDFTSPEATLELARAVADTGKILVIGTTGFSDEQQRELAHLSRRARMVQSGNFSLGVNVLEALVEKATHLLGEAYDIEINEMHHKHKKDAPSGTALMLGGAAARGRGVSLDEKKALDRDGLRKAGDIGFSVLRGGDVVGIHHVHFAGGGELITLSHQGFSRAIYAHGAIKAAIWAQTQPPGLYSMRDVIGL